ARGRVRPVEREGDRAAGVAGTAGERRRVGQADRAVGADREGAAGVGGQRGRARVDDRVLLVGAAGARGAAVVGVTRVARRPVVGACGRDAECRRGGVVLAVGAADSGRGRADLVRERAVVGRVAARGRVRPVEREGDRAAGVAGTARERRRILPLHDALPIYREGAAGVGGQRGRARVDDRVLLVFPYAALFRSVVGVTRVARRP